MILLLLIPIVVALVINYVVAKKFEEIAFQKGYDESIHSFAMCFWLGIVGYLYVIALPNSNNYYNIHSDSIDETVNKTSGNEHDNDNDINSNFDKKECSKEKYEYDKLIAKAEKYKDTFFDRDYRIRVYESIVKDMEPFASVNFEDSVLKLKEYSSHLELLKTKKIK